jgi:hypothetical protein
VRQFGYVLAFVGVAALLTSCGSGSSFSPVLPKNVQRRIAKEDGSFADVPTALPKGSYYEGRFHDAAIEFGLTFRSFSFIVGDGHCPTVSAHIFQIGAVPVRWAGREEDQHAWRCITRGHVRVVISAYHSLHGGNELLGREALLLARVVAHVRYIGPG